MATIDQRIAQETKAMTKREVMLKAIEGRLTWLQAADILGYSGRHMRRLKARYDEFGWGMLRDGRIGNSRRKRIPVETINRVLKLRREKYAEFSVKHFHERVTERHGVKLSYTWTKHLLQAAGLAEKSSGRGKYRRKRERRPMVGMLLHLDASTHTWIRGLPQRDLIVALDDADGQILYSRFVGQEGTLSTFEALEAVFTKHGRFCELYTDRGSHFCRTTEAGDAPDVRQEGEVTRVLRTLGIRQILARTPEARGRSERAFGTIQGRLPQELALEGIDSYDAANLYLEREFVRDFNLRFAVRPAQKESAFMPLPEVDLAMLLTVRSERVVRNDSTILHEGRVLQLEPSPARRHFVRCMVTVHKHLDETLTVTYQANIIGRFTKEGDPRPEALRKAA